MKFTDPRDSAVIQDIIKENQHKSYKDIARTLRERGYDLTPDAVRKRYQFYGLPPKGKKLPIKTKPKEKIIRDKIKTFFTPKSLPDKGNIGIIGDTHLPFEHPKYLDFCLDTFKKYDCSVFVHIGDFMDNHSISYHEHNPNGYSAADEAQEAKKHLIKWVMAFPRLRICIGNHDSLIYRKAITHGLPSDWLRNLNEFWGTPDSWIWDFGFTIQGVKFIHGTGKSGQNAAMTWAKDNRMPTVIGHVHSFGGVNYLASDHDLIFGLNVGCGIDIRRYSFEYGRNFSHRPTVGCGIVSENGTQAIFIPMKM